MVNNQKNTVTGFSLLVQSFLKSVYQGKSCDEIPGTILCTLYNHINNFCQILQKQETQDPKDLNRPNNFGSNKPAVLFFDVALELLNIYLIN